jgi:5,5'-dehydrodivanillate O-demethylase
VQILWERLVVYRGENGEYGCVAERCAHRGCSLYYGFIEDDAIRCPYHGWKYDRDGHVLEQPFEPQDSTFKDKVRQTAYPVQELGGLLFVYMGPQPAPLLPHWDVLVRDDGTRKIMVRPTLTCNWLQAQENTADTTHTYYLHGHMTAMRSGTTPATAYYYRPIVGYDFSLCDWGIEKRCVYGGEHPEEEIRPPLIFPNILRIPEGQNENLHWRVPVDDTHTALIVASFTPAQTGAAPLRQAVVPVEYMPPDVDEKGEYTLDSFACQDRMAWETQGEIYDRSAEHLGASDQGVAMLRKLLDEQITIVEKGGEPIALVRDPEKNRMIEFTSHSLNRLATASTGANR